MSYDPLRSLRVAEVIALVTYHPKILSDYDLWAAGSYYGAWSDNIPVIFKGKNGRPVLGWEDVYFWLAHRDNPDLSGQRKIVVPSCAERLYPPQQ